MSGDEASGSGSGAAVHYDYSNNNRNERSAHHNKPPMFNGDPEMFSWWKTKMYSHIMGMDEELWDVLEDGVGDLKLDEEGAALDRKAHTAEQKKLYKKQHTIRGILVAALPHKECRAIFRRSRLFDKLLTHYIILRLLIENFYLKVGSGGWLYLGKVLAP